MKKRMTKLLLSIFLLFYVLYINIDVILAIVNSEQIIKTGGINTINTDGEEDGVEVSKIISASDIENYFDITLKVKTTEKVSTPDLAIVFVMDISNTMVEGMDGSVSRYTASVNAAKNLINKFSEFSKDASSERLMGYVAFNTDAHKIFDLSECKSECKDLETNKKLSDLMSEKTSAIINDNGYASSHSRFTNIEAGLKMAEDMLATTSIKNKYIILLSDGFPTTYIDEGYNGYDPYMTGKSNITSSTDGKFYNEVYGLPCLYGTSYSDRGAIRARKKATQIENTGVKIFSVGVGINDNNTTKVEDYMKADSTRVNKTDTDDRFAVVDTETTDYEIGKSIQDYKNWLKDDIGSGYYYDASNSSELEDAYNKIFEEVKKLSEVWVTEDPMGLDGNVANIDFLGLYDETYTGEEANGNLTYELKKSSGQINTASFNEKDNKISWDLKESDYIEEDNLYIYELKYRVRLKNELESFVPEKEYDTNAKTTLSYVIKEGNVLSEKKMIDFPIPSVEGYLGKLEFNKKSDFDFVNLSGAEFLLSHDENCECHKEKKYATITDMIATSNEDGLVTFDNIPSGHTYKLKETKALKDHYLLDESDIYDITVSFGTTSGTPVTNGIVNKIIRGNLEIKKVVEGNIEDSGKFKFKLEAWYNGNKLKGEYEYTLNSKVNGKLNIENNIELGHNETIVIKGLPIGSTYKITELTTEGYDVQYQLNSNKVSNGNVVTCDGNCKITQENNKVKFINITGYVLPDTGSNLGLIMYIMSAFILIISTIYISYYFYANKSEI